MAIPDVDIYPSATGPAANIVKQHENAKADHTLYSGWFCPFVQRSWIVLEEKKIPYRYEEINPYKKEASFLALNPRGLVPTLGCPTPSGEKPLIESNIICDYLDQTFPDTPLYPSDAYTKAKLRVSMDFVTTRILPAYHRFLQHTPDKQYSLEDARTELHSHLLTWIKDADPTGPFFAGKDFTMADIVMAPWALRMWVFDHFKDGGFGAPKEGEGGKDEELWTRWRRWSKAVTQRESVKGTMSEKEHYLPLYQRYADDTAQSEMAKAVRAGRGVP